MKRADDIERLIALRKLRIDRAAIALAERSAACEAAQGRVSEASAAAARNGERRRTREDALFDRLTMRPLTTSEIGRAQDALEALEVEANDLDRAEQEAKRALDAERQARHEIAQERVRLERERDKLSALAAGRASLAARRTELVAELDAEDVVSSARPRAAI